MEWRRWPKLLILCIVLSVNFLSFSQEAFDFKSDSIACDTFPPPRNYDGVTFDNAVHIWWDIPELDTGIYPQNLSHFIIFRDNIEFDTMIYTGNDHFDYYDYLGSTYPMWHRYYVTAFYDLSPCGTPGSLGQSVSTDTLEFWAYYAFILSFVEDWSTGSFDPNLWYHDEYWFVNGPYGNPQPCATYSNNADLAYEHKIISYWINTSDHPGTSNTYIDGDFFFDFDIELDHIASGLVDYLTVEIKDSSQWHEIVQFSTDTGSFDWSEQHINITELAKGSYIKLSFTAHGDTGINITEWYIDNIKVYRQCNPPRDLHWVSPDEVMAWSPPLPHTPTKGYKGKGLQGYNIYISYGSQYEFHSFTTDTFHTVDAVGWKSFYITAKYEDCEPASNEIFGPQSLPDIPGETELIIYPNPCHENLHVKSSLPLQSIRIFNTLGDLVLNKGLSNSDIDINTSTFPSGIYFLKINTHGSTQLKKLIINH